MDLRNRQKTLRPRGVATVVDRHYRSEPEENGDITSTKQTIDPASAPRNIFRQYLLNASQWGRRFQLVLL